MPTPIPFAESAAQIEAVLSSLTGDSPDMDIARVHLMDARKNLRNNHPADACEDMQGLASVAFQMQLLAAMNGDLNQSELGNALLTAAVLIAEQLTKEGVDCKISL